MDHISTAGRTFTVRRVGTVNAHEWRKLAGQLRGASDRSVAHFCSDEFVSYLNSEQAAALIAELDRLGHSSVVAALDALVAEVEDGTSVWLALPPAGVTAR